MSKYEPLWKWIHENGTEHFQLTFAQIEEIAGLPIDHSFLKYKKELTGYGFRVVKISMKAETVSFEKTFPDRDIGRIMKGKEPKTVQKAKE